MYLDFAGFYVSISVFGWIFGLRIDDKFLASHLMDAIGIYYPKY